MSGSIGPYYEMPAGAQLPLPSAAFSYGHMDNRRWELCKSGVATLQNPRAKW